MHTSRRNIRVPNEGRMFDMVNATHFFSLFTMVESVYCTAPTTTALRGSFTNDEITFI